jgi:predicted branched-subunit amino acid permease
MVIKVDPVVLTPAGTWRGFRDLLPIAMFSLPFGIGFGAAAINTGLAPFDAIVMSALVFSGAAQFAMLDFVGTDITLASLALVVLAVSARLTVMGAALAPWLNTLPAPRRFAVLAWLSDPNFAKSQPALHGGERDAGYLLGGGLALWTNWVAGTAIGALAGDIIGDVAGFGFDIIVVAFFVTVVVGELRKPPMILPVAVAAVAAISTAGILPDGWNVIAAALSGAVTTLLRHE